MKFCPQCGQRLEKGFAAEERERYIQELEASREATPGNTSGQGKLAIIPEAIKGWNWGAFVFGWLWGIDNKVWIALLSAIPYVGVIMCIVLGVKGNEWAWRHKRWNSIEHFKSTQGKWNTAGIVVFVASIIILVIVFAISP